MKNRIHVRTCLLFAVVTSVFWLGARPVPAAEPPPAAAAHPNPAGRMLRDASLMLLREGNDRFVAGKAQHPNLDSERRVSTVSGGQEPFASILACSDSRSPVELLFDRGVGDLFIIRVAGNIAGESELASLEYGVGHLNTPVLVVLGHSKCGAVTAVTKGAELHGHLHALADKIEPAARKARAEATTADDLIPRAIQANVWNTVEQILRESSIIREKAASGSVHLIGAIYDLESGRATWLGGHPAQDTIIALANQATTDAALAQSRDSFAPGTTHGTGKSTPAAPAGPHGGTTPAPGVEPKVAKTGATAPAHGSPSPKPAAPSRNLVGSPTHDGTEHEAPAHGGHEH